MKSQKPNTDWTRAKGLLAELKSATRRSLSAQVLLGKELRFLKKKMGFQRGDADRFSSKPAQCGFGDFQRVTENETPKTWEKWCQAELGISDDTADRYLR
ncbi:MAG: hypothetical protein EON58_14310, partial [Alphaproteobacteria bacterium]